MLDRICRIDENLLHRTAGPYIGSIHGNPQPEHKMTALHPESDSGQLAPETGGWPIIAGDSDSSSMAKIGSDSGTGSLVWMVR